MTRFTSTSTTVPKFAYVFHFTAPVHFLQKSRQLNILKGDAAHLQCNALGDNPIEITWTGSKNQRISSDMDPRYWERGRLFSPLNSVSGNYDVKVILFRKRYLENEP